MIMRGDMQDTNGVMTTERKTINEKLTAVYRKIGKEPSDKLHQELDRLFQYKPVDNYYTFVRASLYLLTIVLYPIPYSC